MARPGPGLAEKVCGETLTLAAPGALDGPRWHGTVECDLTPGHAEEHMAIDHLGGLDVFAGERDGVCTTITWPR